MSEFKGTPGQHAVLRLSKQAIVEGDLIIVGVDGFHTAYVPAWTDDKETANEARANAALYAAAPELLEACLRMRNQLYAAGYEAEKCSLNPTKCLLAQVESAITKALGQ